MPEAKKDEQLLADTAPLRARHTFQPVIARMPEAKKDEQLLAETSALLSTVPCPIFVLMSDGAPDNWRILDHVLQSVQKEGSLRPKDLVYRIADFFHPSEHLKKNTHPYYCHNRPPAN